MTEARWAMLAVIALSILGVLGDLAVKRAADAGNPASPFLALGALIFGISAFGWYLAMRVLNLATVGAIYSIATLLLLVLAGTVIFGERLHTIEVVAVLVALGTLAALWRFL